MRAIFIREPGGPEVLVVDDVLDLVPPAHHVRIAVRYVGINRADLLQRMGVYPAPEGVPPNIPGLEYSGVVDAVGDGVRGLSVGDRVMGLVAGGAYAEQVIAHEGEVVRTPDSISDRDAAALPEVLVTAYDALLIRGNLAPCETVLVHAAGSGVGTAAIQIAKALGCFVIATSRTHDKLARCKALGADVAIAVKNASFADEVNAITHGRGVDVVIELAGGAYVAEDLRCLASRGRVVVVGLTAGVRADLDLGLLLRKRATVVGTVLRSRPLMEKIQAAEMLQRNILPLVVAGKISAVIDRDFPFSQAPEAHAYVASNESFGKVLLDVGPGR